MMQAKILGITMETQFVMGFNAASGNAMMQVKHRIDAAEEALEFQCRKRQCYDASGERGQCGVDHIDVSMPQAAMP